MNGEHPHPALAPATTRRIALRIGGLLGVAAFFQGLDRLNIAYAGIDLRLDLGLTSTEFGLGAGIFFLSYVAFGIPSNLLMLRFGARRWLGLTMLAWGLASAAMVLARGTTSFYALRFALGAAEAGFAPTMLYLSGIWFPEAIRGRAMAWLLAMGPLAAIVGGPISGMILGADGWLGLQGWQWMFLIEGLPTACFAIAMFALMPDGPATAPWLTDAEKRIVGAGSLSAPQRAGNLIEQVKVVLNPQVLLIGAIIFSLALLAFSLVFFLPQIIRDAGFSDRASVILAGAPPTCGIVFMIAWGRHSDRTGERGWHIALAMTLGVGGALLAALGLDRLLTLGAVCLAMAGIYAAQPLVYTYVGRIIPGGEAAVAIAAIHSIANISGFFGPLIIGIARDRFGGFAAGLTLVAGITALGTLGVLALDRRVKRREPAQA